MGCCDTQSEGGRPKAARRYAYRAIAMIPSRYCRERHDREVRATHPPATPAEPPRGDFVLGGWLLWAKKSRQLPCL